MRYCKDIGRDVFTERSEMSIPPEIPSVVKILKSYYDEQEKQPGHKKDLPLEKREALVAELIDAYKNTPKGERGDTLVPRSIDVLFYNPDDVQPAPIEKFSSEGVDAYHIRYNWPDREGFREGTRRTLILQPGTLLDRIGSPLYGVFAAPLEAIGVPQAIASRALPYYFDDDGDVGSHHAYHVYRVRKAFVVTSNLTELERFGDDRVEVGTVAAAFQDKPKDGGGTQYFLPETIATLISDGYLEEVNMAK